MKLKDYAKLTALVRLKSGLHIGTGERPEHGEPLRIMKSLRTGSPYIPGSSLKGKMRCLLELTYGRRETDPNDNGSPCWCGVCQICLLFGSGSAHKTFEPTRLIFRDSYLTESSQKLFEEIGLEEKPGVRIDRITGKAAHRALFPMERVPEGSEFELEVSVRMFENDDTDAIKQWLTMGLFLMEQDAIGGGGTRGSGYIEFDNVKFADKEFDKNWRYDCEKVKDKLINVPIKKSS